MRDPRLRLEIFDKPKGRALTNEYGAQGIGVLIEALRIIEKAGSTVKNSILTSTIARHLDEDPEQVSQIISFCVEHDILTREEDDTE